MGLVLDGNGFSYGVPGTLDLREASQRVEIGEAQVVGRRGIVVPTFGGVPDAQEWILSGYLWGATVADLRTAFQEFSEVLASGELTLMDSDLNRQARVRLQSLAYERVGGSGARTLRVSARLVVPSGVWQDATFTRDSRTVTLLTTTPAVRNLVLNYPGTASVSPTMRVTLNSGATWTPTVTWKGGNLLASPSFKEGLSTPTSWAVHSGSPELVYGTGNSGVRAASVTSADAWRQVVLVNGNVAHTLSGYLRTPSSGAASVSVQWKDNAGSTISATSTTVAATSAWVRFTLTGQASTNAAVEGWVVLGASSGTVEFDDVQFEESSAASPFAEAKHVSFTRSANLVYGSGHRTWVVEMEKGVVRLRNSSNVWSDDAASANGKFFELEAVKGGRQHVFIAAPTGGTVDVEVAYRARYV